MPQFFCKRRGGYTRKDAGGEVLVRLLEGTAEKGPWYNSSDYSDREITYWLNRGVIEFKDRPIITEG